MFESFKPKQETGNEPTNLGRRTALEKIGILGIGALSSKVLVDTVIKEKNISAVEGTYSPQTPSDSNKSFESTRPEVMSELTETLKSGNKEVFNYSLEYVYALRKEEVTLTARRNTIIAELTDANDADPREPFYLLEHDRINKALSELTILLDAVEKAVCQSPLYSDSVTKETHTPTTAENMPSYNPSLPDTVEKRKLTM